MRSNEEFGSFLDRVDQPFHAAARDLINDWYSHYPDGDDKADVAQRLRGTAVNFQGAFWELWLHEMCLRSGFTVSVHPECPDGRRRDFLVSRNGDAFYLEAHCSFSSDGERRGRRRLEELKEAIAGRLAEPSQAVNLDVHAIGDHALSAKRIASHVNSVAPSMSPWQDDVWAIEEAGWRMTITTTALPRDRGDLPASELLSTMESFGGSLDSVHLAPIRNAVATKAAQASQLDLPYVIAINMCHRHAFLFTDRDAQDALSGSSTTVVDHDLNVIEQRLNTDGVWSGGRTDSVSAIIFASSMGLGRMAKEIPVLFRNPAATRPLSSVLPLPGADPRLGLFGLAEDWPGHEPFEKPYGGTVTRPS